MLNVNPSGSPRRHQDSLCRRCRQAYGSQHSLHHVRESGWNGPCSKNSHKRRSHCREIHHLHHKRSRLRDHRQPCGVHHWSGCPQQTDHPLHGARYQSFSSIQLRKDYLHRFLGPCDPCTSVRCKQETQIDPHSPFKPSRFQTFKLLKFVQILLLYLKLFEKKVGVRRCDQRGDIMQCKSYRF